MDDLDVVSEEVQVAPPQEEAKEGRGWWKALKSHFRRLPLEVLNFFINHDWVFWLIGLINRRLGFIESVFLVYAANDDYGLSFAYPFRVRRTLWTPWPVGLLFQDGKMTVMFGIAASNGQYTDPSNAENLRGLSERVEKLRQLLGAERKTFSGILPGVLYYKRIIHEAPEADLTAAAVLQAIDLVKTKESLEPETPVIVLGGKGFIGRRVVKMLDKSTTYSIDSIDGQDKSHWPNDLSGKRVIVVNITLNNAIENYLDVIWPGTVVINEVYPEPDPTTLKKLSAKNCCCYHVVGVDAMAIPSFPSAYRGAIPCCAAWPSPMMKVVVRKLN